MRICVPQVTKLRKRVCRVAANSLRMAEVVHEERCRQNEGRCEEGAAAQTREEERHGRCRSSVLLLLDVRGELAFDGHVSGGEYRCAESGSKSSRSQLTAWRHGGCRDAQLAKVDPMR
jgi:hypothetical protein